MEYNIITTVYNGDLTVLQNHDSSEGKIIILSGMGTNCIIPQEGSTTEGIVMLLQILIRQEAIREEIQEVPVVMRSEGAIRIMPTFFATRYMEEFLASKVVPNWSPIEGKINPTNTLAPIGSVILNELSHIGLDLVSSAEYSEFKTIVTELHLEGLHQGEEVSSLN
ncbi:hypothetical protein GQX74_005778 [Glossina fuscipes]|nr:hypothetical protein GQX74_005778 [Glossina fuscipes]